MAYGYVQPAPDAVTDRIRADLKAWREAADMTQGQVADKVGAAVLVHLILQRTKLGRYAYAMGSNREAARYAGVPLGACTVGIYAILGMLTGLASMIETSRLMTGQPTAGEGYELRAIAAVVIGGGSLSGGEGTVAGTLVGAFITGLLANGANLLGVSSFWQQVLIGAVIIAAVGLDGWRKKR